MLYVMRLRCHASYATDWHLSLAPTLCMQLFIGIIVVIVINIVVDNIFFTMMPQ